MHKSKYTKEELNKMKKMGVKSGSKKAHVTLSKKKGGQKRSSSTGQIRY